MKKILHTFCFSLSQRQILILVIVFALLSSTDLQAQCAMCRAALESEEAGTSQRHQQRDHILDDFSVLIAGHFRHCYLQKDEKERVNEGIFSVPNEIFYYFLK